MSRPPSLIGPPANAVSIYGYSRERGRELGRARRRRDGKVRVAQVMLTKPISARQRRALSAQIRREGEGQLRAVLTEKVRESAAGSRIYARLCLCVHVGLYFVCICTPRRAVGHSGS